MSEPPATPPPGRLLPLVVGMLAANLVSAALFFGVKLLLDHPTDPGNRALEAERAMFRFVVHRLRWLARVPGLPQPFDAALLAWTGLAHPARLAAMHEIEKRALALPGVQLRTHRLGGTEFSRGPRELGHLHGNGLLDLRVGRTQRDLLVVAGRAEPHHVFTESGWISFWVREKADAPAACELLAIAAGLGGDQEAN